MNITEKDIDNFIRKNGKRILKGILIDFLTSLNGKSEEVPICSDVDLKIGKVQELEKFIEELK